MLQSAAIKSWRDGLSATVSHFETRTDWFEWLNGFRVPAAACIAADSRLPSLILYRNDVATALPAFPKVNEPPGGMVDSSYTALHEIDRFRQNLMNVGYATQIISIKGGGARLVFGQKVVVAGVNALTFSIFVLRVEADSASQYPQFPVNCSRHDKSS
jgi:hypothetical protein